VDARHVEDPDLAGGVNLCGASPSSGGLARLWREVPCTLTLLSVDIIKINSSRRQERVLNDMAAQEGRAAGLIEESMSVLVILEDRLVSFFKTRSPSHKILGLPPNPARSRCSFPVAKQIDTDRYYSQVYDYVKNGEWIGVQEEKTIDAEYATNRRQNGSSP
jgi:hypothetical protein